MNSPTHRSPSPFRRPLAAARTATRAARALIPLTLLALALAAAAPAQDEPLDADFAERVDVDLVQVEVTVTDGEGRPVTGLTRDDFQVRYGGKKVDLSLFSAVAGGAEAAAGTASGDAAADVSDGGGEPASVLFLVDHDHLDGGLPEDSVAAVRDFVAGLGAAGRASVVSARGDSLEIVQPFTADGEAIRGALEGLDLRPSAATAAAEYRRLLAEIRRVEERVASSTPSAGGGDNLTLSTDELPTAVRAQIEGLAQKVFRELAALTLRVDRAITALAGRPGRKELVLVTGALPNRVVHELNLAWSKAFGAASRMRSRESLAASSGGVGRFENQAAEMGVQTADTQELFDLMARRANAHGVTLHVLGSVVNTEASQRVDDPALVAAVAERTGGRAVIGTNAHRVLGAVSDDLTSYYVLAFTPPDALAPRTSRSGDAASQPVKIDVELARRHKGLDVRHRESVQPVDLEERSVRAAVSELLLGPAYGRAGEATGGETDDGSTLGLRADTPSPVEGRDDVLRLPVTVLIPLAALTLVEADGGVHQGRASLFFTTGDLGGGARPVQKVALPLQLSPEQLEGLGERQIEYSIDVPMGLEARRVAVALRDDLSGDILSASTDIQRLRLAP